MDYSLKFIGDFETIFKIFLIEKKQEQSVKNVIKEVFLHVKEKIIKILKDEETFALFSIYFERNLLDFLSMSL